MLAFGVAADFEGVVLFEEFAGGEGGLEFGEEGVAGEGFVETGDEEIVEGGKEEAIDLGSADDEDVGVDEREVREVVRSMDDVDALVVP